MRFNWLRTAVDDGTGPSGQMIRAKVDVVILDLTIPGGMGGKETIRLLQNVSL